MASFLVRVCLSRADGRIWRRVRPCYPELCFFAVCRLLVGDGGDSDLLLDEEELRLDVQEFDLDDCLP